MNERNQGGSVRDKEDGGSVVSRVNSPDSWRTRLTEHNSSVDVHVCPKSWSLTNSITRFIFVDTEIRPRRK